MCKSHMKNVLYASPRRSGRWKNIVSCPSFANGIKNDITSLEKHIIICLLKTE